MRERWELKTILAGATSTLAAQVCRRDRKDVMDGSAFDRLVRHVSEDGSRRGLLRSAFAAAIAGLGVASLLDAEDAEAKKGGRKRKRRRCKPKPAGSPCETSKDCCTKKTKRICAVASNAGNSDLTCCGGEGAECGGDNDIGDNLAPFCCAGFSCSTSKDDNTAGGKGTCVKNVV